MLWKGWAWLDPVVSLAISLAIVLGTWGLLRDSVNLALAAVPEGIDGAEVEAFLAGLAGVEAVHDLHILGMSTTEAALTAHLVCPMPTEGDRLVTQASLELHERFGIEHITIQVETGAKPCKQASAEVV